MAQPSSRQGLIDYALRKLGAPVLEINIDDDQIDDLVDDAIQIFNERHFDGVEEMFLKHEFTQDELDRGKATSQTDSDNTAGIVTTTGTSTTISGYGQLPQVLLKILTLFKFQTQLLELKRYLNLIVVLFQVECLVSNINYF